MHLGQDAWAGNVVTPQVLQTEPMSLGSASGHVNSPSAMGTCCLPATFMTFTLLP